MTRQSILAFVLGSSLFTVACGTVAHGTSQRVPIISSPSGAIVTADCGLGPRHVGETPVVVKLSRKADRCIINVQKEGYEERSVILNRHLSGWIWGNLFLPYAIPGVLVDLFDGGAFYRAPASVRVNLNEPSGTSDSWREGRSR